MGEGENELLTWVAGLWGRTAVAGKARMDNGVRKKRGMRADSFMGYQVSFAFIKE